MIRIKGITKEYESHRALNCVSADILESSTTVLIGPSGCGKSTLIRMLVGLIEPDKGEIVYENQHLSQMDLQLLRHRIGYVIQEGGLFPHLSIENNISIMGQNLKWSSNQIKSRIRELCDLTQFPCEALQRFPREISGGQRQRVSLMRALFLNPDYLFLDEPLGALDPMIRRQLQDDLKVIFQKLKKTVVLVTHDLAEASYFGDSIILLNQGKIEQMGKIEDFMNQPNSQFVSDFVSAQRGLS